MYHQWDMEYLIFYNKAEMFLFKFFAQPSYSLMEVHQVITSTEEKFRNQCTRRQ